MKGKLALVIVLIFALYLTGCAGDRLIRLETQTKTLQGRVDGVNEQVTALGEQAKKIQESQQEEKDRAQGIDKKLDDIASRLADLEEEAEEVSAEDVEEEANPAIPEAKPAVPEAKPAVPEAKLLKSAAPKIKVLSGNGSLPSAVLMARKIESLGYKVEKVDYAPRSNFQTHTVYYASTSQEAAENLIKKLSCGVVSKPMTWYSIFDIIVVTGK